MNEERFLYKFGLTLTPALFLVSSLQETIAVSVTSIVLLGLLHGWIFLLGRTMKLDPNDLASSADEGSRGVHPTSYSCHSEAEDSGLRRRRIRLWRRRISEILRRFAPQDDNGVLHQVGHTRSRAWPFWSEMPVIVAIGFLAGLAPGMAGILCPWIGTGSNIFLPVILGNVLLHWGGESRAVKGRAALWFTFALLIFNLFCFRDGVRLIKSPLVIFSTVGGILTLLGIFFRRRWATL